ncbi:glycosyltransferase family 4 protein [Arsukibacterium ikkense]|uniref:glycosyltransferase family 4 protein n=1 Tax=Arsukibacterium ikkense TaxID=336831 RepID=UPI001379202E|nr:glycosyltransferase family 4 protein [Arsukibacterium ikkense]
MKIIFFCNDLPFFVNHFSTLARRTHEKGYDVIVLAGGATPEAVHSVERLGCRLIQLNISRSGTNPWQELAAFRQIWQVIRAENPDIMQLLTIKPCIYGGIAARFLKVPKVVGTVTGLGYTFSGSTLKAIIRKNMLLFLYRFAFGGSRRDVKLVFENLDDKSFFEQSKVILPAQTSRVWGAGVDLKRFSFKSQHPIAASDKVFRVVLPSRMLKDKGILEFIAAADILKNKGAPVEMVLVGGTDSANPASLKNEDIMQWVDRGVITWLGYRNDMPEQLQQADIVCLPSYREGMPKVILEAMACGKAIITTNVPGCREAIEPLVHGLIVPAADSAALAAAIVQLVENPKQLEMMGHAARQRATMLFADTMIADNYLSLYEVSAGFGS